LLPPKFTSGESDAKKGFGGSGDQNAFVPRGMWSTVALFAVLTTMYAVVWSLPAPTLISKISLLRQSWHLSDVMQEPPRLKKEVEAAEKEVAELKKKLEEVRSKNDEVQKSTDSSEGTMKELKADAERVRLETARMRGENDGLSRKLEKVKNREIEYQEKMKRLEDMELPLLNSIPDEDDADEVA